MTDDTSHFTPDAIIEEAQRTLGDPVQRPRHYNAHTSGVEAIELCEWLSFNTGNALKYVWRAGHKGRLREDLNKALWYIEREIIRRVHNPPAPGLPNEFLAARARLVVQHEAPVSLLAVMIMSLAMPPVVTPTHLDNARHFLKLALSEIKVHQHSYKGGNGIVYRSCGVEGSEYEYDADSAKVTCEECRRLAT